MCGGQGREVGAVLFDVGGSFFVGAVVGQVGKPDMVGSDFAGGFQGLQKIKVSRVFFYAKAVYYKVDEAAAFFESAAFMNKFN